MVTTWKSNARLAWRKSLWMGMMLLALLLAIMIQRGTSTEIKWTAASDHNKHNNGDPRKETAATAPRSKRYWIENNIEIPDYAKTDSELAMERSAGKHGGSIAAKYWILVLLLLIVVAIGTISALGFSVWTPLSGQHGSGHRLGSTSTHRSAGLSSWLSVMTKSASKSAEENARLARLSRFEGNKGD